MVRHVLFYGGLRACGAQTVRVSGLVWTIAVTAVLNIRRRRRRSREEVSLILRGNWSLPTVHMGHTPYGVFPISVVGGRRKAGGGGPTTQMGYNPISLVGGWRKGVTAKEDQYVPPPATHQ